MGALLRLIALFLCLGLAPAGDLSAADRRIALLIGNQNYSDALGKLTNPHNDVTLLELALKSLHFEVAVARDVGLRDLVRVVNAHVRRVREAGPGTIALFYFSGHGAQNPSTGVNYIFPTDIGRISEEFWDSAVRLSDITGKLKVEANQASHFVILDACRRELRWGSSAKAVTDVKGFVREREESGMLIAFATAEGELASDAGQGAGPYSTALAIEIVKPGVEAITVFRNVQLQVRERIRQEPWFGVGKLGRVYFAAEQAPPPPLPSPDAKATMSGQLPLVTSPAAVAWGTAKESTNPLIVEDFLSRFGNVPPYGELARKKLEELRKREEIASVDRPLVAQQMAVVAAAETTRPSVYIVQKGDTLADIAKRNKLTVEQLRQLNKISDTTKIKAGTKLVIAPHVSQDSARIAVAATAPASVPPSGEPSEAKFDWPVRGQVIASFGDRPGKPSNDGINIAAPVGADILAAADGQVAYASNELKGYGNLVLVRHDNGWVSAYAHTNEILVKRGDIVKRGQVIATVGKTGNVETPQLHFELRRDAKPVDPIQFLAR